MGVGSGGIVEVSKMISFDRKKIDWIGSRSLDPVTRPFYYDGSYYKAVFPSALAHIDHLVSCGVLDELSQLSLIPRYSIHSSNLPEFPLVIKQETEFFELCHDMWNPLLVKDAALTFIRINMILAKHDLGLMDGHKANFIVQNNSRVKWCDIGSIMKVSRSSVAGFNEFLQFLVYPLLLRKRSPCFSKLMRYYFSTGCSHEEAMLLIGKSFNLTKNRDQILAFFEKFVKDIDFIPVVPSGEVDDCIKNKLSLFQDDVKNFFKENSSYSLWSAMDEKKFKTVLNFSSGQGLFSLMLAELGAEVLSLTEDETNASICHANFKTASKDYKIKIGIGGLESYVFQKADAVVSMSQSNISFFKKRYTVEDIARQFSRLTNRYLITEYSAISGEALSAQRSLGINDFSLENFIRSFSRFFSRIDVYENSMQNDKVVLIAQKLTHNNSQVVFNS